MKDKLIGTAYVNIIKDEKGVVKVFEMFSGYGGASFGLKKANIPYECIGISEIDKYAVQCFNTNFPNIKNYGDCRNINPNELPDFDLLTGGTPCQDFSIAGKREGMFDKEGNPTRSGLIFEYVKILKAKQPKYFLWENVEGVLSSKDKITGEYHFDFILELFSEAGYEVDFRLLNSKDYGIPQSRSRVWVLGVRKDLKTLQVSS